MLDISCWILVKGEAQESGIKEQKLKFFSDV